MDHQPDLTPLWIVVGAGAILGGLRWIAKRLLMVSPTYAALEKLSAEQREFHDTIVADVKALHDGLGALAGHQEAQDARQVGSDIRIDKLERAGLNRDGR